MKTKSPILLNLYSRSFDKWAKLLPADIAKDQARHDVWATVDRACGASSIAEVARTLGFKPERIRNIRAVMRHYDTKRGNMTPVEAYMLRDGKRIKA